MPSIEIVRGRTSRWLSRCSRSQASSVEAGGGLQVGDLDQPHLAGHPAYVVRPGQGGQLGRGVAPVGASERGRREPGVQHRAALVEGDQGVAPRVRRCLAHAGDSTERGCRHPRLGSPRGPRAVEGGRPADLRPGPAARRATSRRPSRRGPAPDGAAGRADRAARGAERGPGAVEPARFGVRPGRAARPDRPAGAHRAPGLRPPQRGPRAVPGRDVDLAGPRAAQGVAARQRRRGSRPTTAAGGRSSTSCGGRVRCRPARSRTPARCRGRPRAGTTTRTSRCCSG